MGIANWCDIGLDAMMQMGRRRLTHFQTLTQVAKMFDKCVVCGEPRAEKRLSCEKHHTQFQREARQNEGYPSWYARTVNHKDRLDRWLHPR